MQARYSDFWSAAQREAVKRQVEDLQWYGVDWRVSAISLAKDIAVGMDLSTEDLDALVSLIRTSDRLVVMARLLEVL